MVSTRSSKYGRRETSCTMDARPLQALLNKASRSERSVRRRVCHVAEDDAQCSTVFDRHSSSLVSRWYLKVSAPTMSHPKSTSRPRCHVGNDGRSGSFQSCRIFAVISTIARRDSWKPVLKGDKHLTYLERLELVKGECLYLCWCV